MALHRIIILTVCMLYIIADIFLDIESLVLYLPSPTPCPCELPGILHRHHQICQPLECLCLFLPCFFRFGLYFQCQQRQLISTVIYFRHPFHMMLFFHFPFSWIFPGDLSVQFCCFPHVRYAPVFFRYGRNASLLIAQQDMPAVVMDTFLKYRL